MSEVQTGIVGYQNNMNSYTPIIGMEIHVELKTKSKMFCGCKNDPFHAPKPNTHTCPVCLGLPGALPVPNKKALEWCIKIGLALNCEIPENSKFDRKNYFYPDLAKGYQISQYDQPLAINGWLEIPNSKSQVPKKIRIRRVHMEEDTGKLMHATVEGKPVTLVDFNRSGVPLVEIVTEPDIHSSEQAREFLKKLHQIIRYLEVSDADMDKGSMRLEPNISLAESGKWKAESNETKLPNYKVEVKNINSFGFVKKAIDYELARHEKILESGETPVQETRGWDEKKNVTVSQRRKEEAHDYRYFPEPDIPPMRWDSDQISVIRNQLPELPDDKIKRFITAYGLSEQDVLRLTETKELADYFESVKRKAESVKEISVKDIANWLLNKRIDITKVSPEELLKQISVGKIKIAIDPGKLDQAVDAVIKNNPGPLAQYKSGKTGVIMFFVGQIMREFKGQADAGVIKNLLEEKLQK